MNILVIGSGGREHALVKSFKKSSLAKKIFALPGNDGMSEDAELVPLSLACSDFPLISDFCFKNSISFVFIGPEDPLVNGLSDHLRSQGIACVGPSCEAAQLEGSKIFAKDFMNRARVPTARSFVVDSVEATLEKSVNFQPPYILKADGLAAGKGVFICRDTLQLRAAAEDLFVRKTLGEAGSRALLEENLPGWELSYLILTNGERYEALPLAQDHKRLKDNDEGPNTGGMGTVAPLKIEAALEEKIRAQILQPSIAQLHKEVFLYYGVLFIGIMIVDEQPYVLEYNTRFGDPETQVILPLLKNDTVELFSALAHGQLQSVKSHPDLYTACVVNAAEGYPTEPRRGDRIVFTEDIRNHLIFAGVKKQNDHLVTAGGRVLNVVMTATNLQESLSKVYQINEKIDFLGRQFRKDIGAKIKI